MLTDVLVPHNRWDLLDPYPAPRPRVSVVVVHYEQHAQLRLVLAALARQTLPPFEVIVADDGSRKPPPAGPGVRVVTQPDEGFRAAAARNLGARSATGEVLVFLDADTVPEPDFLRALTSRVARCPDVLAVGRRGHADLSALAPGDDPTAAPRFVEPSWLSDGYAATGDLLRADGRSFRYVISAVMACRASLFTDLDGFDPRFTGYGGEDWDIAYRAWNAGAVLVHEPTAVAWHDGPDWAGRDDPRALDTQTTRLAALIPEPSTRGAADPGDIPDVLVDISPDADLPRIADSVLRQGFPDFAIRGPGATWNTDQQRRARARLRVRCPLPPSALAEAMDVLVAEDLSEVVLTCAGEHAATLSSARARGRARRWDGRLPAGDVHASFGSADLEVGPPR